MGVFFGAGMLMIRCLTIVLLGMIDLKLTLAYIGLDLGLYLAVKMLRGDFWYWVPLGGNAEIFSSLICRVMVKIITDFTSIVQFRHPYELGGMYWSFGFVMTIVTLPVAITIYASQGGAASVVRLAWRLLYILIPSTLVMFCVFFINIDKKYRHTFYSTERGKDLTIRNFKENSEDSTKASFTFQMSRHHWSSIEEEVRSWVESNWSRWEEGKPKWLDKNMKTKIPVELIPTKKARKAEKERRSIVEKESELKSKRKKIKKKVKKTTSNVTRTLSVGIARMLSSSSKIDPTISRTIVPEE